MSMKNAAFFFTCTACTMLLAANPLLAKKLDGDQKTSYALGARIGKQFKEQDFDLNEPLFVQGFQDSFHARKAQFSEKEIDQTLLAFQKNQLKKRKEKFEQQASKNLKDSNAFLAQNKTQKGVVTLKNGLQYKIITPGKGASPTLEDSVTVNYKGTLVDGTQFDSSYDRKKPATFPVSAVIAGWKQAIQLMKPGATWQLFIPPELAYGKRGSGHKIGPNMALIFEVALLSVNKVNTKEPQKN